MSKCKNNSIEIDVLLEELETANVEVREEINNTINENIPKNESNEQLQDETHKRAQLLKLSEDGDLDKSVNYIKKASNKVINKLYTEYEERRTLKGNELLTDLLISKFSGILGCLGAVSREEELTMELKSN